MALLQIAEPGQSAAPHQHKRGIGIDLGTTNSLVATVRSGAATTIEDDQGRAILPSIVHFGLQGLAVGYDAAAFIVNDPLNTISSAKRLIGRSMADVNLQHFPYQFADDQSPHIQTRSGLVNPVEVSSKILSVLAQRAQLALQDEADGAVITVPAYFDDAQRQGTKDAAKLAGLHVLRLLNEPTAAAIAYGLDSGDEGLIAVYDLGGGTFDISVLRLSKGIFEVLATGGDSALGGDDFDHALVSLMLSKASFDGELSVSSLRELQLEATRVKIALSAETTIQVELQLQELSINTSISRAEFEALITPLVKKTLRASKRALRDAQVDVSEIENVVMVGGSTRVPLVRAEVAKLFGCEPLTSIDPDQVVAIGAAIQADILVGNKPDGELLLLDVTPLSLGIETMGGLVEKIIPRNTTIPVARAQEFTTFKDGQTQMAVHVLQGERELVDDCRSLARFTLKDIPALAAGAAHIRVTFQIDADGLLSVTAKEKSSGASASVEVKPSYGLADEQVAKMLQDSIENAQLDVNARMLKEQQVDAARLIENMSAALQVDGENLLEISERQSIEESLLKLQQVAGQSDIKAIEMAVKALDLASQEFASRRMDHSIRHALKGQAVDNL